MSRAKLPLAAALAALACACSAPPPAVKPQGAEAPAGPSAARVYDKRMFKLVRTPNPDLDSALDGALTGSWQAAAKNLAGDKPLDIGFTYSMTPRGATYPFSDIEVSCIMQEKYFRKGEKLCGDFFTELDARLKKAVEKLKK